MKIDQNNNNEKKKIVKFKTENKNLENQLVNEIDSSKISLSLSQLSNIRPRFTEEMIKKLTERLPKSKDSISYLSEAPTINSIKESPLVSVPMVMNEDKQDLQGSCYFSCPLGFIDVQVKGKIVKFLVDSGSMVNLIPDRMAFELGMEKTQIDLEMSGVGGEGCDICGVVEFEPITVGSFTGPVHLFTAIKAVLPILGRPFLFDYKCQLEYFGRGEILTFQGQNGRRIEITLSKQGEGRWEKKKDILDQPISSTYFST